MRRALLLLFALFAPAAFATRELVTPRLRVLYEDPALAAYAQRVAFQAERALDTLIPLFGTTPPPVVLRLEDTTDLYNALASPLPRPSVGLRALFPTEVALGYTPDDLRLVLLHELTHIMQFAYTEGGPGLGRVGEGVATPTPSWLTEGLAVWVESEFTFKLDLGGRLNDALTRGLVESVALEGRWPTLADASLGTYGGWPGAQTQYLFGAGFVDHLIDKHGFGAVLASLRAYNAGGLPSPFSRAWRGAVGTALEDEWAAWRREVTRRARGRAARGGRRAGERKTVTGWYTYAPALSPDGRRLTWVSWPPAINVAEVAGGELTNVRTLLEDRFLTGLEWRDAHTLLYARPVPRPGHTYSEIFTLDARTGRETQLTEGARARFPTPAPGGCLLFVRDVATARAQLRRLCGGRTETLWRAPAGVHPVGLAVSEGGRIALSVWERGFVDLALLEGGRLRYLTRDAAQDLEPAWRGERGLVFRSNRAGVFDLFEVAAEAPERVARLTRTLGGAFTPEVAETGLWYAALGGKGYDLAFLPSVTPGETRPLKRAAPPRRVAPITRFPVRAYSPYKSLAPYGWLPTGVGLEGTPVGVAVEGTLFGEDDSTDHSYRVSVGFASALAETGGFYANARYDYRAASPLRASARPVSFGVQVGAWPHAPHLSGERETAVGLKGSVSARLPLDAYLAGLDLEAGLLHLPRQGRTDRVVSLDARVEGTLSDARADPWGYPTEGVRGSLTGVWSATGGAPSLGAWLDAAYVTPLPSLGPLKLGTLELAARAGYRPVWPLPLAPDADLSAVTAVGLRRSLPLVLRYGDGLFAAERLTLEPRLRAWLDSSLHLGGDLTLSLDTVVGYGAPVSLSGTLGYAGGLWTRFGLRLPL